jgi:hypothetical protein
MFIIVQTMLLCYIRKMIKKRGSRKIHSRYAKRFVNSISRKERVLRDRRIPRVALQHPKTSPWMTLLDSRNDQALITLTGFDFETFHWLVNRFRPLCGTCRSRPATPIGQPLLREITLKFLMQSTSNLATPIVASQFLHLLHAITNVDAPNTNRILDQYSKPLTDFGLDTVAKFEDFFAYRHHPC